MLNIIKKSSVSTKLLLASFFLVLFSIPLQSLAQIDEFASSAFTGENRVDLGSDVGGSDFASQYYSMAPSEPKKDDNYLQQVANFVESIFGKNFLTLFVNSGLEISDAFHQWALALAGGLALASMFWAVLMAWIKKKPVIDPVLEVLLYAAIAAFGINYYRTLITDVIALADGVMQYSEAGSVGNAVLDFYFAICHPIIDSAKDFFDGLAGLEVLKMVTSIISLALAGVALIFAFIALRQLMTVLLIGPMFLSVGLALGPLFIATLASGFTRRWFDQWLNFVISSSMLTAVLVLALKIVAGVMRNIAVTGKGNGTDSPGLMLGYALFCWALSSLLAAIPQIVDALFPGRTGAAGIKLENPIPKPGKK